MEILKKGIQKKSDYKYKFVVANGIDENGKQIRTSKIFIINENLTENQKIKLLNEEYEDFKNQVKKTKGYSINITFDEFQKIYFKEYGKTDIKKSTAYNYKTTVKNHINPKFKNIKVKDITTQQINDFLLNLKLKNSSKKKTKIVFSSIMEYAKKLKIIDYNPVHDSKYKLKDENIENEDNKNTDNYLEKEDYEKLKKIVEVYSNFNILIYFLMYSGMRMGEALALTWNDIDFNNNEIRINKTLSYAEKETYISTPKTENSIREINIPKKVIDKLKEHKIQQEKLIANCNGTFKHKELVFTSPIGNYYDKSNMNTQFKKLLKKNNIKIITIHGIRHTVVSLLIDKLDIYKISKYIGDSIATIENTYSHFLKKHKTDVADVLNDL